MSYLLRKNSFSYLWLKKEKQGNSFKEFPCFFLCRIINYQIPVSEKPTDIYCNTETIPDCQ